MCLAKSPNCRGSHVVFHGTKELLLSSSSSSDSIIDDDHDHENEDRDKSSMFTVEQSPGFATIHWGDHPHETTRMEAGGYRTNIIATFCYRNDDDDKSVGGDGTIRRRRNNSSTKVALRSCYNV
jgi:hypothetical protein